MLYLNSKLTTNNKYKLDEPINGTFKLVSFTFTNNIFNVNDTNNKIYFNENGSNLITKLDNGFYDSTDFVSHLNTKLNETAIGTITTNINENTRKLTITNTLNMYFTFGTNTTNSAHTLMGFNNTDGSPSTSITSDKCIDLNTYKNVWIDFVQNNNRLIYGTDYFNTSLYISGLGNFGEIVRYIETDNFEQYVCFKNTKEIKLNFHDTNHNNIDLNSDYELIFQKC